LIKKLFLHMFIIAILLVSVLQLHSLPARDLSGAGERGRIILSTTTSTQDSGLLDFLLPIFTRETGWEVDVIAVGTGAALRMGRDGDADVLLVHAMAEELQFVEDGFGLRRFDVMYNDFLVVGPNITDIVPNADINHTFREIASRNLGFVSRGDNSGTHVMENNLWASLGISPASFSSYISAGQGMGATLQIADELGAYTLTDRATWLIFSRDDRINLPAICEGAVELLNYYGIIAVNPAMHPHVNSQGAEAFVEWMLSDSTQNLIGQYGLAEFGGALFTPNSHP